MNRNILNISARSELPYWWVQSVAIEYLECRDYTTRNDIWAFNFDLISDQDLMNAVKSERVVISGPIVHYPQLERKSLLKSLENYFLGRDDDLEEHVVEGLCSWNDFPEEVEFLDYWDPLSSFSEYFQVYDDGNFWQWKIAELKQMKGNPKGKWVSPDVDLTLINDLGLKCIELRNNIIKPGEPGHKEFKKDVEQFYWELKEIRREILSKLWEVHQKRKEFMNI